MNELQHYVDLRCPYCGEWIGLVVDGSIDQQSYIEDCQVCCRPIEVEVTLDEAGTPAVRARSQDDG